MKTFETGTRSPQKAAAAALSVLMASCVLTVLACQNPLFASSAALGSGAKASLSVSFTIPASRSVVASPDNLTSAISTLAIAIVDGSSATVASASGIGYSAGVVKTFGSLSPGTYTIAVNAYSAASALIATGSSSVTVAANTDQTVTVNLSFSQSASTGGFSLALIWPVSTGLAYVYATVDGAAISIPTVTADATNYSATLTAPNLAGGAHLLSIYFKTSAGATIVIGPYVESVNIWDGVTSACWIDSSGNSATARSFAAADFASSNANLAGVTFTGATPTSSFAAGTTSYTLTDISGADFSFAATSVSGSQNVACTWNGAPQTWNSVTSTTFTSQNLAWVAGTNTLQITVTAADRQTTKTYTAEFTIVSAANLATALASDLAGSYILTEDVDTTGGGDWAPIGSAAMPFTGTFDGNGHTVKITNNVVTDTYVGLFGVIGTGGTVENIVLQGTLSGDVCTGSVAGLNRGTISGCSSSAAISANGYNSTGGIVGENYGTVEYCAFTGTINQVTAGMVTDIGGIVGRGWGGRIYRCYATGAITGLTTNSHFLGGIIGAANTPPATIQECYATGAITGYRYIGGLVGGVTSGVITDCYARGNVTGNVCVGGLVGGNDTNAVTNSYATGTVAWTTNGGFLIGLIGTLPTQCYDSNIADATYYSATLGTALPAGWDTGIWTRNGAVNGGFPYLPNTHVP